MATAPPVETQQDISLKQLKSPTPEEVYFCQSAKDGDVKSLSKAIAEGININCVDYYGRTALHYASEGNSPESIKILVANGANVNVRDWNGVTPLHLAAKGDHLLILKFLLVSGAMWDLRTRSDCMAIDFVPHETDMWKVLHGASQGKLITVDHLMQTRDIPLIPQHALQPKPKSAASGKKKGKKSGKKGGKKGGKKSGKKGRKK